MDFFSKAFLLLLEKDNEGSGFYSNTPFSNDRQR